MWFFCDELPHVTQTAGPGGDAPEARNFGGCYVFGIQSYAQLEDIYGQKRQRPACLTS
ncbi:type IV secretion system DNA-binding domain-containing protein [Escherichia coli]